MSSSATTDAEATEQIAQASTLFLYSAAVLFLAVAWSLYFTASLQMFATIGLPLYFLYLIQTRPPKSSFDAKQQVKRVLSGSDLPDDDPRKPRGLIHRGIRNITSTLATTAATAGGYTENFYNIAFLATVVKVSMPTAGLEMYWIGCASQWFYYGAVDTSNNKRD